MPSQTTLFDELVIDSFAGGGGASTGIELAAGRPVDIAINHNPGAIAMHRANLPELCGNRLENMEQLRQEMAC